MKRNGMRYRKAVPFLLIAFVLVAATAILPHLKRKVQHKGSSLYSPYTPILVPALTYHAAVLCFFVSIVPTFFITCAMSENSRLEDLAENPAFVLGTYALILTPLALYVYHDILDTRWRPVWKLVRYLVAYFLLYCLAGIGLIAYMVIQGIADDWKEVGASALALILGTYGAWKLTRLARIIMAHRTLVHVLQRIDIALCKSTGLKPVGLEYYLFRRPKLSHGQSKRLYRSHWNQETRHNFISSSLFDDDYPGEAAARIRWLSFFRRRIIVLKEDADECASRVALWMRLVLRRPRSEPWRLLTSTSPLVQGHLYRTSLGETLRSLMTYGSVAPAPSHVDMNPAEELLNNGSLTKVGIGFFWICSEMGSEEMSQVLAEMPPRWMRGVTQNGKQLVFELVMSLIMCEMPEADNRDLEWLLSLPVLGWNRDVKSLRVWSVMSEICADAVMCVMPRYSELGEMPEPSVIYETVRQGVFELRDATSHHHGFQGDTIGLSLIELIRAAYRAGYLAEQLLGPALQTELKRTDWTDQHNQHRLYKCEIVTGLLSIFCALGLNDDDYYQEMFASFKKQHGLDSNLTDIMQAMQERSKKEAQESYDLDVISRSRRWFLVERSGQCDDPASAFATISAVATELAPFVLQMVTSYLGRQGNVHFSFEHADPEKFREQWMLWKQTQALEIGGSTEAIRMHQLGGTTISPVKDITLDVDN